MKNRNDHIYSVVAVTYGGKEILIRSMHYKNEAKKLMHKVDMNFAADLEDCYRFVKVFDEEGNELFSRSNRRDKTICEKLKLNYYGTESIA